MSNIFLISDTHFSHANCLNFYLKDGVTKLRPNFSCVEEMDEVMVDNWNKTVRPCDKVYHCGDVAMSHKNLPILARLNGEKILIKGNHDKAKLSQYSPYFKDVRGSHQLDYFLLTHIPVHPMNLYRFPVNIHGHLHDGRVMKNDGTIDPRYFCVCVEQINYTPISLEFIKQQVKNESY